MIRSVVRAYNWSVTEVMKLYLDDRDAFGLEFWYADVKDAIKTKE